ncbi:MAG: AraC family transcriptional regulator [Treponema sp.]|nr:AraC family transcriptional regulator [Treponema sp.]
MGGSNLVWHGRYHSHDITDYEIHVFFEGEGQILLNRSKFPIEANRLFLAKPKEFHSILPDAVRKPVTYYAIRFESSENETDKEVLSLLNNSFGPLSIDARERFFIEDLYRLTGENDPAKQRATEYLLLSLLFRWYGGVKPADQDHGSRDSQRHYIDKTLSIMEKSIRKKLNVGVLADKIGLSEEYLIRIFHDRLGMTPFQYFTRLKTEASSSLLSRTNLPIQHIAEHFGFENPFHFSRVFKKCIGLSPSAYRKTFALQGENEESYPLNSKTEIP